MAASPGLVSSADINAFPNPSIASLAKAVFRFDVLACKFPSGFSTRRDPTAKQVAERIKLLSQALRLAILMERSSQETADIGTQLLLSMRQLQFLGKTGRLHPSHQVVLRVGLGLVEQIVVGLNDLNPPADSFTSLTESS